MSIIYEALKKVDKTLKKPNESLAASNVQVKPKPYLVYILTVIIAIFVANVIFGFINKSRNIAISQARPSSVSALLKTEIVQNPVANQINNVAEPKNEVKNVIQEDVALNGVFFEQGNGYALINNKIVKVGDVVAGATVKNISLEGVDLEGPAGNFKLNNPQKG